MKSLVLERLLTLITCFSFATSASIGVPLASFGDNGTALSQGNWIIHTVDAGENMAWETSIAIDSLGYPHICYPYYLPYPEHRRILKHAWWDGGKWYNETVDAQGNVATLSLVIDKNDRLHVAYDDIVPYSRNLKYALGTGSSWNITLVDSEGMTGGGASIDLDDSGNPHISYYYQTQDDLKYAKRNGTSWAIETVDSLAYVGGHSSLKFDKNNTPHISYFDRTSDDLKHAWWDGNTWRNETVDSVGQLGDFTSLGIDDRGHLHISYLNTEYDDLKYAEWNGTGWRTELVDSPLREGWYNSIGVDKNDVPHISYWDASNGDLKYAVRTGAPWITEVVDSKDWVGQYSSLAIDEKNIPHISYYNRTGKSLMYATRKLPMENMPPVADAIAESVANEGSPVTFDASGSYDPEGGALSFAWDFDSLIDSNGDGNFVNDIDATGATPNHVYYDNGNYTVTLKVTDTVGQSDTATTVATVINVAPTAEADGPFEGDEPHTVQFTGTFTDPGTLDTHTFQWDFDFDGITFNVDSTEQNPTHQWLDDFNGTIAFKVIDDDGGWDLDVTHVTVHNVPPEATANGPHQGFEGTPIHFNGNHTDPGPLDTHTYEWDFDYDGTTFAPDATGDPIQKTWYDDYSEDIALRVTDDDGGWDIDVTTVTIDNVPPIADAGDDKEGYEVSTFTFDGSFYDPGKGDTHIFEWDFDYDGVIFDVDVSGQAVSHTFSDDFDGYVALRVTDDDGGVGIDTSHVLVKNVPPTVTLEVLPIEVDASLRIAGEKWHDVTIELYEDGTLIASGTLVRYPGSPNDQMLSLTQVQVDYSKKYSAIVRYTPEDDPINGQPNGANPCWIILTFSDGQELRIHHTFNVQHPDTYIWEVDLTAAILSHGMTFKATASDPGADELTFHWDFGDGTNVTTFYPNVNETYPVEIMEIINHVFPGSGTYTVTVTVEDDDGGIGVAVITVTIP